jgi:hypothetical protein
MTLSHQVSCYTWPRALIIHALVAWEPPILTYTPFPPSEADGESLCKIRSVKCLWRFAHHYNQKSLYTLRFVAENISATESLVLDPGSTPLESPIFKIWFETSMSKSVLELLPQLSVCPNFMLVGVMLAANSGGGGINMSYISPPQSRFDCNHHTISINLSLPGVSEKKHIANIKVLQAHRSPNPLWTTDKLQDQDLQNQF